MSKTQLVSFLVILLGVILYAWSLDRRMSKLENDVRYLKDKQSEKDKQLW